MRASQEPSVKAKMPPGGLEISLFHFLCQFCSVPHFLPSCIILEAALKKNPVTHIKIMQELVTSSLAPEGIGLPASSSTFGFDAK